jgi:hypothetical protein
MLATSKVLRSLQIFKDNPGLKELKSLDRHPFQLAQLTPNVRFSLDEEMLYIPVMGKQRALSK